MKRVLSIVDESGQPIDDSIEYRRDRFNAVVDALCIFCGMIAFVITVSVAFFHGSEYAVSFSDIADFVLKGCSL